MRVLILGANGYLGNRLGRYLENIPETDVIAVVRKGGGELTWAKEVWNYAEIKEYLPKQKPDWVINCICQYERNIGYGREEDLLTANYLVPFNVFNLCMKNDISQFITMDTGLPEKLNLYCKSKKQFADMMLFCLDQHSIKNDYIFWNVLLENFYGEDEPESRFLPSVIKALQEDKEISLTKGLQKRDFIYIDDVVENIVRLMQIKEKGRVDIPLGTGENPSIRELILYLKEIMKSQSKLQFGVVASRVNEPDTVADKVIMDQYGLQIRYHWQDGLKYMLERMDVL